MELIRPPSPPELLADSVDSLGHDQHGPFARLREKLAQRAVEAPRKDDSLSLLRDERERAFELAHAIGVQSQQPPLCLHFADAPEALRIRWYEVDDVRNWVSHAAIVVVRRRYPSPVFRLPSPACQLSLELQT